MNKIPRPKPRTYKEGDQYNDKDYRYVIIRRSGNVVLLDGYVRAEKLPWLKEDVLTNYVVGTVKKDKSKKEYLSIEGTFMSLNGMDKSLTMFNELVGKESK